MINPSITGWVDKFFAEQQIDFIEESDFDWYNTIRKTGFLFGHIIEIKGFPIAIILQWKEEETSKIALLSVLYRLYLYNNKFCNVEQFLESILQFYTTINPEGFWSLKKYISTSKSSKLEEILNQRVQTNHDIISKNFSHIVTNALLFVDVLCYNKYLENNTLDENYLKKIEEIILSTITLVLRKKSNKSKYDDALVKLFESSLRYTKFSKISQSNSINDLNFDFLSNNFEKLYLFDLANMSLWSDGKMQAEEIYFLEELGKNIGIHKEWIADSIHYTNAFFSLYKSKIQYFNYSNPVKHFYNQTTNNVIFLIKRNRKRLTKEISESKELMQLLAKSTKSNLDPDEKKKVKKQLLDICKTVPSLTIFLLPGGGLLLPILIKFIPQLLPSAFNENREDS